MGSNNSRAWALLLGLPKVKNLDFSHLHHKVWDRRRQPNQLPHAYAHQYWVLLGFQFSMAQEDPELSFTFLSLISRINRAEAWISVRTHHGKSRLVVEASRPTTSTCENGHRLRLGHRKRDVSVAIDKQASKRIWNSEVSYLMAGFGFEFISLDNIRNYQNWFNVHWRYLYMDGHLYRHEHRLEQNNVTLDLSLASRNAPAREFEIIFWE